MHELAEKHGFGVAAVINRNVGTPSCVECKKDYEKVSKDKWKPACEHGKDETLVVG
ncbi:MAG: hypothetical protein HY376_03310 [Candidatus Blackburnbacteria bacterium]|nr:hypothetical protein [Candidatus Blackburnbacteria bacterium]